MIDIDPRTATLIDLVIRLHDPIDALTFCDDPTFPMPMIDRSIATRIRSFFDYFSDSTIDDLIDLAATYAPISLLADPCLNFTPTISTLLDTLDDTPLILADYALNCELDIMQPRLISCITALLNARHDDEAELELRCNTLRDTIIDTDDDFDDADIALIMAAAQYTDDTFSNHAAHIRDALRDNGHHAD